MALPSEDLLADRRLAIALLRGVLGINITVDGGRRIWSGVGTFAHGLQAGFAKSPLPAGMVLAYAYALPFAEALLGLLVLFGLFRRPAYVLGLLLLASLTFGSALRQDWTPASEQLIYALLYAVLLATRVWDRYCLDALRQPAV